MGFFSKKRHGKMTATSTDNRRFAWQIENFSKYKSGTTLDSGTVVCFTGVKFHLHMALSVEGDVGLYLHYKSTGIPKYSYYYTNTKETVMRQHTAHTIPPHTGRCGHWNTCYHPDLVQFLGEEDTLTVNFFFDDDTLTVHREPQQNTVTVLWTVPKLFQQMVNPFSSKGFSNDRNLLVVRLDVKKKVGTNDTVDVFDMENVKDFVVFVFCRKGKIPPHSVELMDDQQKVIVKLEKKEDGGSQPLTVPKERVFDAIGKEGGLLVRIELQAGGNPLDALNLLSGLQQPQGENDDDEDKAELSQKEGADDDENDPNTRTVKLGENNEEYHAMNGDD